MTVVNSILNMLISVSMVSNAVAVGTITLLSLLPKIEQLSYYHHIA